MDDATFDHLARRVETLASRRTTLAAIAAAGLAAALGGPRLGTVAKRKKKKCKPKPPAKTCAGRCGSVRNNCKKTVDCGNCGLGTVCLDGTCQECGFIDGPCCSSDNCQAGAVCIAGTCERCGQTDEQCCANDTCNVGRVCLSGTCEDCGIAGQPCCANNACLFGATCSGGQCVD